MKKIFKWRKVLMILAIIILITLIVINIPESKKQIKTQHFTFIYSNSIGTEKINELKEALENNYARISQDLKTIPASNIEVNIYAQRWRYIKATGNWSASGNIEGTSKLHFVEQAWTESDSKKIAIHEFTHAVVLKLLIDREPQLLDGKKFDVKFSGLPVWLWEATSVYEAGQFYNPKTMPFFANDSYPGLSELNDRSKGGKIYSVGYTIIEYILHQYGHDKLIELIANYGDLSGVLKVTEEEFSKGWYDFVKNKYLKQ
jgi:hypothetical protein